MCAYTSDELQERVPLGAAITLTPLSQRTGELDRIIDEYAVGRSRGARGEEQELSLLYVALTRARERSTVSYAGAPSILLPTSTGATTSGKRPKKAI